jgi:GAF domain-containing protein
LLADTAERLQRGDDPDLEVLPALFRALAAERVVDASLGFVVTELGEAMRLGFMEGFEREVMQRCLTLDFGQAICGTVAANRKAIHATDIQRSLDPMCELVRQAGVQAYACEPLMVRGRVLGTLSFASRTRRCFDPEELDFFHLIARLVAIARDRARRNRVVPLLQPVPAFA